MMYLISPQPTDYPLSAGVLITRDKSAGTSGFISAIQEGQKEV